MIPITHNTNAGTVHRVNTAAAPAHCPAIDSELGPCTKWCGRALCLFQSDCVRPVRAEPRTRLQRLARWWHIRNARVHLQQLVDHHQALKRGGVAGPTELARWRDRIGAARVNVAIAERP